MDVTLSRAVAHSRRAHVYRTAADRDQPLIRADPRSDRRRLLRMLSAEELALIWRTDPAFSLPADAPDRGARHIEARATLDLWLCEEKGYRAEAVA